MVNTAFTGNGKSVYVDLSAYADFLGKNKEEKNVHLTISFVDCIKWQANT